MAEVYELIQELAMQRNAFSHFTRDLSMKKKPSHDIHQLIEPLLAVQ